MLLVEAVDAAGDVLDDPVEALQQAAARVRAARHNLPVALCHVLQAQGLGGGVPCKMGLGASGSIVGSWEYCSRKGLC